MGVKVFKDQQTGEIIYLHSDIPEHKKRISELRNSEDWLEYFEYD